MLAVSPSSEGRTEPAGARQRTLRIEYTFEHIARQFRHIQGVVFGRRYL